jgi:hypothetical protein
VQASQDEVRTACVSGRVSLHSMWNDTDIPLAYFITFRGYGTSLHGDERTSVDHLHHQYGAPRIPTNELWQRYNESQLKREPVILDAENGCWQASLSPWVDKGSKRHLWNERSVALATEYVVSGQGEELPDFD